MKVRFEQRRKEVRHRARWMAGEKVKLAQRITSAKALRQSLRGSFSQQPGDLGAGGRIRKAESRGSKASTVRTQHQEMLPNSPDSQLLSWETRGSGLAKHIFSCNTGQGCLLQMGIHCSESHRACLIPCEQSRPWHQGAASNRDTQTCCHHPLFPSCLDHPPSLSPDLCLFCVSPMKTPAGQYPQREGSPRQWKGVYILVSTKETLPLERMNGLPGVFAHTSVEDCQGPRNTLASYFCHT